MCSRVSRQLTFLSSFCTAGCTSWLWLPAGGLLLASVCLSSHSSCRLAPDSGEPGGWGSGCWVPLWISIFLRRALDRAGEQDKGDQMSRWTPPEEASPLMQTDLCTPSAVHSEHRNTSKDHSYDTKSHYSTLWMFLTNLNSKVHSLQVTSSVTLKLNWRPFLIIGTKWYISNLNSLKR